MAWHFGQEELEELYKEFSSETDIVISVLAGSYIDKMMRELLLKKFSKGSTSDKLLDPLRGRLADYQIKADILYCLNLITKEVYQDICSLARIRNIFAHSHQKFTFTNKALRSVIVEFKASCDDKGVRISKLKDSPERSDFLLTVSTIIVRLNEALIEESREPEPQTTAPQT